MQSIIYLLETNLVIFTGFVFILSLFVGSFLNVVIYRIPLMLEREWFSSIHELLTERINEKKITYIKLIDEGCSACGHKTDVKDLGDGLKNIKAFNIAWPPSSCPHCGYKIKGYQNIPLISYFLILRGKCAGCKVKISWQYPLIELITACLSALIAYQFGFGWACLSFLFFIWVLVALTVIDFQHYLLPDNLTLPLMWLGLLLSYFKIIPVDFASSFLGAVFGYLSLWSVYWIFKLLFRKEGMGYGDFKLLAALGAWLGYQSLFFIIFISAFLGAIIGSIYLIISKKGKEHPIPFGPYLVGAAFIVLFLGHFLNAGFNYYLNLF